MDEFWVCPKCRSLNRANANRCYSCHWKFGQPVPSSGSLSSNAGPSAGRPAAGNAPSGPPAAQPQSPQPQSPQPQGPQQMQAPAMASAPPQPAQQFGAGQYGLQQPGRPPAPLTPPPGVATFAGAAAAATATPAAGRRRIGLPHLRGSKQATGQPPAASAPQLPASPGQPAAPSYQATPATRFAAPAAAYVGAPGYGSYAPAAIAPSGLRSRGRLSRVGGFFVRLPGIRGIAEAFAPRGGFVSVRNLGYLTAALLVLLAATFAMLVPIGARLAGQAIDDGSIDGVRASIQAGDEAGLQLLLTVFAALGALVLVLFACVVGVSTHNAPGVGADQPLQLPTRAARSWFNLVWALGRIAFAFIVPVYLFTIGFGIVGGAVVIVLLERLQRDVDDVTGWLVRPARHLTDLYDKLALKGRGSRLALAWRVAFYSANVLAIGALAIPLAVVLATQVETYARNARLTSLSSETVLNVSRQVAMVELGLFAITTLLALILLVPLTIDLARRQQTRRFLVIAGLARPWAGGAPADPRLAALATNAPAAPYADDEDRGYAGQSGDDFVPQPGMDEPGQPQIPAWRRREVTRDAAPVTFASWIDRLKADQAREEQVRNATDKLEEQSLSERQPQAAPPAAAPAAPGAQPMPPAEPAEG